MGKAKAYIAYFVSPHGFGHAARASAVMSALYSVEPALHFDIFTTIPRWFFSDSVTGSFGYHPTFTDIGLVQKTSLEENLPETIRRLNEFLPFSASHVDELAERIKRLGCRLVLCDIAPLGIAVAKAADIPSVLIENFTWDWIYRPFARRAVELRHTISYLRTVFHSADVHIQTEPVCRPQRADFVAAPTSRKPRTSRRRIRQQLGIPSRARTVLITMGGVPERHGFLERLSSLAPVYFIVPGASRSGQKRGNVVLLPHRSDFFHPDLMNASDAVIGKSGYSTVAEAFHAGLPFGYVSRAIFPESAVMARFIQTRMHGLEISGVRFQQGDWLDTVPQLLSFPRQDHDDSNGADEISQFLFANWSSIN